MSKRRLAGLILHAALASFVLLSVLLAASCNPPRHTKNHTGADFRASLIPTSASIDKRWQPVPASQASMASHGKKSVTQWKVTFHYSGGWDSLVNHVKSAGSKAGFRLASQHKVTGGMYLPKDKGATLTCPARGETIELSEENELFTILLDYEY